MTHNAAEMPLLDVTGTGSPGFFPFPPAAKSDVRWRNLKRFWVSSRRGDSAVNRFLLR